MATVHISQDDSRYPSALRIHADAPISIAALGNVEIFQQKNLALFCSVKCPGSIILQTYDLTRALRDAGVSVISGFHSPMEKECLSLLLRGTQPVIICPARSLERMRIPAEWKTPLTEGRLLLLSPFTGNNPRMTASLAQKRNEFVARLADKVFVAHATPDSKTERFCRDALSWRKPLLTLENDDNAHLLALGARQIRPEDAGELWISDS
jgi:predicted Rossmann fold nucleotide-binding protein DprA/Smf involved in DNA uptake